MTLRIALATTVDTAPSKVYDVLRTTEGQRAFWTSDCELDEHHGRFGFLEAPVDLNVSIALVADELVRMKVESGFPGWNGSTWEWALSEHHDAPDTTNVQFRHYDFEAGYEESDLAYTAQSWAMILDRLARYVKSGVPDPFFANDAT
jgi:Activator of Hsp90 ATPase homolog 1-like protein